MSEVLVRRKKSDDIVIALIGNPNVGKSTMFNKLTGMNQHTGNWPGKTVDIAQGRYSYKGKDYILVDLPGTYSLLSQSEEEQIAVEFILSGQADCILIVGDATCLERNLNLILQVMEFTDRLILCVNLLDEAERREMCPDLKVLEQLLGIPVVGTAAGTGRGLAELREKLRNMADGFLRYTPKRVLSGNKAALLSSDASERSAISLLLSEKSAEISKAVFKHCGKPHCSHGDKIALGRWTGRIILIALLFAIFWITIQAANYPSMLLQRIFNCMGKGLNAISSVFPPWLQSLLMDGIFTTVTRVISVMLPPMMIFFPLFTILEDLGYLPRAAFLMDHSFQNCGGCGKQALTMAMGFGCNAVGVMGCRIISSPKERMIAILTNALVPCNGRFPAMIAFISMFFTNRSLLGAFILTGFVLLSVCMTYLTSILLHKTVLRGQDSCFVLELPPYRKPQIRRILIRSILDRVVFVLGRAVTVAVPAGIIIWGLQRISVDGIALLTMTAARLEPIGVFLGMNGAILLAFILAFPANELLMPLTMMIIQGGGVLQEVGLQSMRTALVDAGWTVRTVICVLIFILFHWPCGTTCLTIRKETGSRSWTIAAILLPTVLGVLLCRFITCIL